MERWNRWSGIVVGLLMLLYSAAIALGLAPVPSARSVAALTTLSIGVHCVERALRPS